MFSRIFATKNVWNVTLFSIFIKYYGWALEKKAHANDTTKLVVLTNMIYFSNIL